MVLNGCYYLHTFLLHCSRGLCHIAPVHAAPFSPAARHTTPRPMLMNRYGNISNARPLLHLGGAHFMALLVRHVCHRSSAPVWQPPGPRIFLVSLAEPHKSNDCCTWARNPAYQQRGATQFPSHRQHTQPRNARIGTATPHARPAHDRHMSRPFPSYSTAPQPSRTGLRTDPRNHLSRSAVAPPARLYPVSCACRLVSKPVSNPGISKWPSP